MKKSVLKRTLSAVLSVTLLFGTLVTALSANAAEGYWEKHSIDYEAEEKMNEDNWTYVHGRTHRTSTGVTSGDNPSSVGTWFSQNSVAVTMGLEWGGNTSQLNSTAYSRIQPNLPEGARITEVSFHMRTKAEKFSSPSEIIYSYDPETKAYDAIGMSGLWGNQATYIVKQNEETTTPDHPAKHNGVFFTLNCDGETTPPRTDLFTTDYDVTLKYTYKADGKADIAFTLTEPMGYTSFGTQTKTITDVENPCLLLSGASPLGGNSWLVWASYDKVKLEYETYVDLSAEVEAFKAANPQIDVATVTAENAIEKAEAANKAIEAYNDLPAGDLKAALEDYANTFHAVVSRAYGLTTKTFTDDFNVQATSSAYYVPEYLPNNIGGTNDKQNEQTMEYQANGSVRFYAPVHANNTTFNKVYRLTPDKAGVGVVSSASFKFFTGTYSTVTGPLYIYLGDAPVMVLQTMNTWNAEQSRYDVTRCIVDLFGKSYRNDRRRTDMNSTNAVEGIIDATDNNNGLKYTADFSKAYTSGENDPSGWLTFKYEMQANGRAECYIYNAQGEVVFHVTKTTGYDYDTGNGIIDLFDYSDLKGLGFSVGTGATGKVFSYVDDLQISYDNSEDLAAPAIEGATIATERSMEMQDLRFKASFDTTKAVPAGYTPVEYGVMLMISQRMPLNGTLTMGSIGQEGLELIVASQTVEEGKRIPANFTADLRGTSAKKMLGYRFTVRAYAVYADEAGNKVYVYSNNDKAETAVENGQCSKSVFGVAKTIALVQMDTYNAPEDAAVRAIAEKTTAATDEEKSQLLYYINENIDCLPNN